MVKVKIYNRRFLTLHNISTRNTLKMDLSVMKNTFFQRNGVSGPKRYFPKLIESCSFMPTYQLIKLIGLLCWTKKVSFSS